MCVLLNGSNELSMPYHTPVYIVVDYCRLLLLHKNIHSCINCVWMRARYQYYFKHAVKWYVPKKEKSTADKRGEKRINTHWMCISLERLLVVRKLWANIQTLNRKNVANVAICYLSLSLFRFRRLNSLLYFFFFNPCIACTTNIYLNTLNENVLHAFKMCTMCI